MRHDEHLKGENRIVCTSARHFSWLKRQSRRYFRRLLKALGEDAPKKLPMRGWYA